MDALQDDDLVKGLLADQARLEAARAPLESVWREIDERVDPIGGGGFGGRAIGEVAGRYNFDATAVTSADRCTAAIAGISIPRNQQYIGLKFADKDLNKLAAVRRWCEAASDRLYAIRYAPHAGFEMQAHDDIKQTVKYGPAPFWIGCEPHVGMFYRAVDLSECYFEQDFRGRVDTVHRKFEKSVRQLEQQFGADAMTPKMAKARSASSCTMRGPSDARASGRSVVVANVRPPIQPDAPAVSGDDDRAQAAPRMREATLRRNQSA